MKQEMLDLCVWTIEQAKSAGAADAKVTVSRSRSVEVAYRQRKPETVKEATSRSLSLQVYVDGRYSGLSTADLRKEALKQFVAEAVATTRLLAEDPLRTLPDPKYYQGRAEVDLKLYDPTYPEWTSAQRHETAQAIESACIEAGGRKAVSVTAEVRDQHGQSAVVSSNGLEGFSEGTACMMAAAMTARDEGDRRPEGYYFAAARSRQAMPETALVGKTAAERTLGMLGAKKVRTETLPIIVESHLVGRVLGGLLAAMTGASVHQKQSFLAEKKGQQIGSQRLTLIDDPLLVGALGSGLYDDDGFATRRRTMIDAGTLADFFVSWYYSRKLGWKPTTGSPNNLVIPPGQRSVEAIMKDLGRGILVTEFLGGNSNSTTGDFSLGIGGRMFEDGQLGQAVAEMNVADNHLKFWPKLAEAANDPWIYGSMRTPSLVFEDVVVAGI